MKSRNKQLEESVQDNCEPDQHENARQELAIQQARLVNSLLGLSPAPGEVDSRQVEVCGESLKRKRARTLEKFLGEQGPGTSGGITQDMERYFQKNPGPHPDGPRADFNQYQRFMTQGLYRRMIKWLLQCLNERDDRKR